MLLEQEAWDKIILESNNIVDQNIESSDLVVSYCIVQSWPEEKLSAILLLDFVLVDDWILFLEAVSMIFGEQGGHGAAVEGKYWDHVGTV